MRNKHTLKWEVLHIVGSFVNFATLLAFGIFWFTSSFGRNALWKLEFPATP